MSVSTVVDYTLSEEIRKLMMYASVGIEDTFTAKGGTLYNYILSCYTDSRVHHEIPCGDSIIAIFPYCASLTGWGITTVPHVC